MSPPTPKKKPTPKKSPASTALTLVRSPLQAPQAPEAPPPRPRVILIDPQPVVPPTKAEPPAGTSGPLPKIPKEYTRQGVRKGAGVRLRPRTRKGALKIQVAVFLSPVAVALLKARPWATYAQLIEDAILTTYGRPTTTTTTKKRKARAR